MASKKGGRPKIASSHAGFRSSGRPAPKKRRGPPPKKAAPRKPEPYFVPQRRENRGRRTEVRSEPSEHAKAAALVVAMAALDKKALDVQIIDVVGRIDYADYLVLMSGRSDRHVVAIADGIEEELRKERDALPARKPSFVEGRTMGTWIVLDFGDVVAHVFQEEARSHYDLDSLWQDARRVPLSS
jgi:ribosome-associated protein